MKLKLTLMHGSGSTWYVNGKAFQTNGGLYAAMDIALAYGLQRPDIIDLPYEYQKLQWKYNAATNTYELEDNR